jgi:hypothetical protein
MVITKFSPSIAVNSVAMAFTGADARFIRDTCQFERQRPVDPNNINRLAFEMEQGRFVPGTPIYFGVLPDGKRLLLNGNHTLEAVAKCNITQTLTMIECSVSSVDEAAAIYAMMDIHKTRSWTNSLQAYGLTEKMQMANYMLPAIRLIEGSFDRTTVNRNMSRSQIFSVMDDYIVQANLIANAFKGTLLSNQKVLRRASFMAVALLTARDQPTAAEEFWGGMAKDNGLVKGDPRKMLLDFGRDNNSVSVETYNHVKAAAQAWNAFFNKKELAFLRPSQMSELKILGTSWQKGNPNPPAQEPVDMSKMVKTPSKEEIAAKLVTQTKLPFVVAEKKGALPVAEKKASKAFDISKVPATPSKAKAAAELSTEVISTRLVTTR